MSPVRARLAGSAALVAASMLAALAAAPFANRTAVWTGLAVALALALPSYLSMAWAIRRPDKVFFSTFALGLFGRLAGLAAAALAVRRLGRPSLAATLVSAVVALLGLSFIEFYFINREGRS